MRTGAGSADRHRTVHPRYPHRLAESPQCYGLVGFGTDAGLTLCHRKRPGQSGHSSAAAEFHEFSDSCIFAGNRAAIRTGRLEENHGEKGWWKQVRLDWTILHEIRAFLTCPLLDMLMPKITMLGNSGAVWILAAGGLLCTKKYRKYGIIMLAGLAMGGLVGNVFLKHLIARPRPCWLDQSVPLLIAVPNDYSFPSGHTLASVIGATILTAADRRFGLIAIPLAILIAFSRLYLYVHFPSDILGAVILGLGIGALTLCGGNWTEKWLYAHKAFEKQHL